MWNGRTIFDRLQDIENVNITLAFSGPVLSRLTGGLYCQQLFTFYCLAASYMSCQFRMNEWVSEWVVINIYCIRCVLKLVRILPHECTLGCGPRIWTRTCQYIQLVRSVTSSSNIVCISINLTCYIFKSIQQIWTNISNFGVKNCHLIFTLLHPTLYWLPVNEVQDHHACAQMS